MNIHKYLIPSISLFCFFILSSCKEKCYEGELYILTYNVAGLPEGISSSSPATYTSFISSLINEYDIVHVQEDFCYHDLLISNNTHSYITQPMPCVPEGDGLNTFSNFPIRNLDRNAWTDCSGFDCLTPKGFSYTQIEIEPELWVDFYNIHCNAGGSDADKAARRNNLFQIMEYIQTHSSDRPIIVMGDFNSRYTREGDTIRTFLDNGFSDLWIDLINNDIVPPHGDKLDGCEPLQTSATCESIDKIFFRGNSEIEFTSIDFQFGDDDRYFYNGDLNQPLSDHSPVVARIRYQSK